MMQVWVIFTVIDTVGYQIPVNHIVCKLEADLLDRQSVQLVQEKLSELQQLHNGRVNFMYFSREPELPPVEYKGEQ